MNRNRWKLVNHIFHAAMDLPPNERHAFILSASNGDAALECEVEQLIRADQDAGSYLESPMIAFDGPPLLPETTPFQSGDILSGRFQIIRPIAAGGMGYVFEAYDTELAVRVALKVIRPEIAADQEAIARFRQEVRLARRITHPNVCRTFDIDHETRVLSSTLGTSQEIVFLTMEFLEGETLAAKLARDGPLDLNEALTIARQIAEALDSAHALSIVHRDIKPSNIMLVPVAPSAQELLSLLAEKAFRAKRAVITDFGLARLDTLVSVPGNDSSSHSRRRVGTLAYMAPEQLEGSAVSPATDVYAFGLIIFEMVTGVRAFPTDDFLGGITKRLRGSFPSAKKLAPALPRNWELAIEGCLRPLPSERFQRAGAVVDALGGNPSQLHQGKYEKVFSSAGDFFVKVLATLRRFWRAFALAFMALVLAGLATGLRIYLTESNSKVDPGALVYLTHVTNETGERSLDNVTDLIQSGLIQSAHINMLDQGVIGDTLQLMKKSPNSIIDPSVAREIAMRTGAVRVIFASVTGANGNYRLNVDIQQPGDAPSRYRDHWKKSWVWTMPATIAVGVFPTEVLKVVRDANDWIRHECGESANDLARLNMAPEDVTTGNWQALEEYSHALLQIAANRKESAIIALQNAIRIDPNFALAYARLGDNLVSIGRLEEGYLAYLNALNSVSGERLTRRERDFIKGTFASDTRDFNSAETAFRDYSAYYENDFIGWFYQGLPLDMLDRPKDAIAVLLRAEKLSPNTKRAAGGLAYSYMLTGDFPSARRWIADLDRAGRSDIALYLRGVDQFLENNLVAAEQSFKELSNVASDDYRSLGYSSLARVQAEQRRYDAALQSLSLGIAFNDDHGNNLDAGSQWLDKAYINCKLGLYKLCLQEVRKGLELNQSPDAILWASSTLGSAIPNVPHSMASSYLVELHRMQAILPSGNLGLVYSLARERVHGEIMLARGDSRSGLAAFREADSIDSPLDAREYLARGLLAVAKIDGNSNTAYALKSEALQAYAKGAARPAAVWRNAWNYPPGFVADQREEYAKLATNLQRGHTSDPTSSKVSKQILSPPSFLSKEQHATQSQASANIIH